MRALSAADVVSVWERGTGQHPVDRALTILAAWSGESGEDLARASIGCRDARLLELYELLFGSALEAFAECPACAERLEYDLPVAGLAREPVRTGKEVMAAANDISLRLRMPDSRDLAAVRECPDAARAGRMIAERCVVEARRGEVSIAPADLADEVLEQAGTQLAAADPRAEILIDLSCAACGHHWQVLLDIESFLWARLNALAKRLLGEVHALASAYGWSEAEILALSALRRAFYLDRVS